ncbi:DUF192 domain-containing protein [Egibacter rhizosphaerae]|uniref:DUF192 domain-containing protein n=1 Tax=Egibacter rhizosphaerae TaxID=1670831 RepID=UPI0013F15F53|nr:DUF192 domain-containing protein [Egibacter rhizosphaerae]
MRLLVNGEAVAEVEIADTAWSRLRGALGKQPLAGALLLDPCRSVHSVGLRAPLDVAFCDRDLRVLRTVRLRPWRMTRVVRESRVVVEAEPGSFDRWGVRPSSLLGIDT